MGRIVGGANTLSKMPERFPGYYPRSLVRGKGSRVWDASGREYVDWICALGAVGLGYGDPRVDSAVRDQVSRGPIFSLPCVELEESVAEELCGLVPCAEAVRFLKTGSEATEAAIRAARAYTGRDLVLMPSSSYHSWHSWYAATRLYAPGIPFAMRDLVRKFAYNDLRSLDTLLDADEGSVEGGALENSRTGEPVREHVAAVIMEPTLFELPAPGFLEGVLERCGKIGALLIFDEMVTGFRWHEGGYQALCGVTPDLATFGKALGNGYPAAALVGRGAPMRWARLASGTFNGDLIGLAAARATMRAYREADVCDHMWKVGSVLMQEYGAAARRLGVPSRVEGQPYHPRIAWDEEDSPAPEQAGSYDPPVGAKNRHRASLFFQEVAKRGSLFHPDGINVMRDHTEEDLVRTLAACREAAEVVARAIDRRSVQAQLEGPPISPEPPWRVTQ